MPRTARRRRPAQREWRPVAAGLAVASRDTDIKLAVSQAKLHASFLMLSGGASGASSAATAALCTPGGAHSTPVAATAMQQFLMPALAS